LTSDRDAVLAAVGVNGAALQYAPIQFKENKDVVLASVRQNGLALEFASAAMQGDMDIAQAAVHQNGFALRYVRPLLKKKISLTLAAVPGNGDAFTSADREMKEKKDLVLQVVAEEGGALCCASGTLRGDLDVVSEAVKSNPSALRFAKGSVKEAIQSSMTTSGTSTLPGVMVVLSLNAGLGDNLTPFSSRFLRAWKEHAFMSQFEVCRTSTRFSRACKACTSPSTDAGDTCSGTRETCKSMFENMSQDDRPWAATCWRYAVRFHLQECKENQGFMVQIKEGSRLSDVQVFEETLANEVGIKIFRASIFQVSSRTVLERISRAVRQWSSNERADMSLQELNN